MELSEKLKKTLESLKKAYEMLDARILQTSKTYQDIVREIHETAENLVNSIRKHEEALVSKATEVSQIILCEFEGKKEDIEMQIDDIDTLFSYHEKMERWIAETSEDAITDDKQDWQKAIVSQMVNLCTIHDDLRTPNSQFIEFQRLLADPGLVDVFCHFGDIITSCLYEINMEKGKGLQCGHLIDESANVYRQSQQSSYEETDSSYEAIPYL